MLNCIWITLGKFNDGETSWIQLFIQGDGDIQNYMKILYINGFYYIVTTIATVGYGDISCQTSYEMFFACLCMFFGIALFAYIQGGLVDAIKNSLLSGEIKLSQVQEEFQTWLIQREQNIRFPIESKKLKTMRECFKLSYQNDFSNTILESEYYLSLPPLIQEKMFTFYFSQHVKTYSIFFRNICDTHLIRQIIGALKHVQQVSFNQSQKNESFFQFNKSIPSNTFIQTYYQKSKGIYFISSGKVIISKFYEMDDKLEQLPFKELSYGSFFGENCLLKNYQMLNYIVDKDQDLYAFFISQDKLFEILDEHPQIIKRLVRLARLRNKFFKLEGETVMEQNQVYLKNNSLTKQNFRKRDSKKQKIDQELEDIKQNLKVVYDQENKARKQNGQTVQEDEDEDSIEEEEQEEEDSELDILEKIKINNKIPLLQQFEDSIEQQKQMYFDGIQNEQIIQSIFKNMKIFDEKKQPRGAINTQNVYTYKKNSVQNIAYKVQEVVVEQQEEIESNNYETPIESSKQQIQQNQTIEKENNQTQLKSSNQSNTISLFASSQQAINQRESQSNQNNDLLFKSQSSYQNSDNYDSQNQNLIDQQIQNSQKTEPSSKLRQQQQQLAMAKQLSSAEKQNNINLESKKSNSFSEQRFQQLENQSPQTKKKLSEYYFESLTNQAAFSKNNKDGEVNTQSDLPLKTETTEFNLQLVQTLQSNDEIELIDFYQIDEKTDETFKDSKIDLQNLQYLQSNRQIHQKACLDNLNNQKLLNQNENYNQSLKEEIGEQENQSLEKQQENQVVWITKASNCRKSIFKQNSDKKSDDQDQQQQEQLYEEGSDQSQKDTQMFRQLKTLQYKKQFVGQKEQRLYGSFQNFNHNNILNEQFDLLQSKVEKNQININLNKNKSYKYLNSKSALLNQQKRQQQQIDEILNQSRIENQNYKNQQQILKSSNFGNQLVHFNQNNQSSGEQGRQAQNQNEFSQSPQSQNSLQFTVNNQADKSLKYNDEILTPQNRVENKYNKSFSHLLVSNLDDQDNLNKPHLSNYKTLIQIMRITYQFHKNQKQEDIYHYQEAAEEDINQTNQNEQNLELQLKSYVEIDDNENEDNQQIENMLDKSIDVPIDIVEPSFTLSELNKIFPYLKFSINILDERTNALLQNVQEFKKFCETKVQKIQELRSRKQQSQDNNPNILQKSKKKNSYRQKQFKRVTSLYHNVK